MGAEPAEAAETAASARAAHGTVLGAVGVVSRAFLRVGEHVVGVVHLFELRLGVLLFRFARAGVHIGVILLGEFAVSGFELIRARVLVHAQYFVITLVCHILSPPSAAQKRE